MNQYQTFSPTSSQLNYIYTAQEAIIGQKGFSQFAADYSSEYDIPPWIQRPSGFLDFDQVNAIALPGAPLPAAANVIFGNVPQGYDGVIEYYSCNFTGGGFVDGSGDIIWRVLADGRAIRNFENIQSEMGSLATPRPVKIRIYSNQNYAFTVTHVANLLLAGNIICCLKGYFYPRKGE